MIEAIAFTLVAGLLSFAARGLAGLREGYHALGALADEVDQIEEEIEQAKPEMRGSDGRN